MTLRRLLERPLNYTGRSMRWGCVVVSLALAACLAAPPPNTVIEEPPPDATPPGGSPIALNGLAAHGALTIGGRDDLVLIGQRDGLPVAIVLSPEGPLFKDVTASAITLPYDPVDLVITRWASLTRLAVALGPGGPLQAIDQDGALIELALTEEGSSPAAPFTRLGQINADNHRLLLSDDQEFYVSDPLGTGNPGEQPIDLVFLGGAPGPLLLAGANSTSTAGIGIIKEDNEIDVHAFSEVDVPAVGDDLALDQTTPSPLSRPFWRMVGMSMVLLGIDPSRTGIWYHSTPLSDGEIATGIEEVPGVDEIHDLLMTRLDGTVVELILLAEMAGQLQVMVYLNPEATPALETPLVLPISGLTPPYWIEAMDAVADGGAQNEIIVYDQAGHIACVDLVNELPESCGSLDLAAAVTLSGASTSGRPGW